MRLLGISSSTRWCEDKIMYRKLVEYEYKGTRMDLSDSEQFHCRFCNETKTANDFLEDAHAIAECIENTAIYTHYECDRCNHNISKYESELGKLCTFYRANRNIRKKGGKKTKLPGTDIYYNKEEAIYSETVDPSKNPYACIVMGTDNDGRDFLFKMRSITINEPYIYKALLKFSLSVVPENICSKLSQGFAILKENEMFSQLCIGIFRKNRIDNPKIRIYQYIGDTQLPRLFSCIDIFQSTYILFLDFNNPYCNFAPYEILSDCVDSSLVPEDDISEIKIVDLSNPKSKITQAEEIFGHFTS